MLILWTEIRSKILKQVTFPNKAPSLDLMLPFLMNSSWRGTRLQSHYNLFPFPDDFQHPPLWNGKATLTLKAVWNSRPEKVISKWQLLSWPCHDNEPLSVSVSLSPAVFIFCILSPLHVPLKHYQSPSNLQAMEITKSQQRHYANTKYY